MISYVDVDKHNGKVKPSNICTMKNGLSSVNCDCDFTRSNSSSLLTPTVIRKSSHSTFHFKNEPCKTAEIRLDVNTDLNFKIKKKLYFRYFMSVLLFCLFLGQAILNYFQSQQLRTELKVTQEHLYMLEDNLNTVHTLFSSVREKLKTLEGFTEDNEILDKEHSISKREIGPHMKCSDCANTTHQAHSVSRGSYAVHLRGALPEIFVKDGGIIAPWYIDKTSSGAFLLTDGVIGESRGVFEVIEEGLYFIYAQMYYLTSSSLNSYSINLQLSEEKGREDTVVATCSAEAANSKLSELSCFTAVVRYLHQGDRIFVIQRERNRRIIFRDNKSFLGLTLLNSAHSFIQ